MAFKLQTQCACVVCSAILEHGQRCDCSPDKPRAHLAPNPLVLRGVSGAVLFVNNPNQQTPDTELIAAVQENLNAKRPSVSAASRALSDLVVFLNAPPVADLLARIEELKAGIKAQSAICRDTKYFSPENEKARIERSALMGKLDDARQMLRRVKAFNKRRAA